MRRTLFKSKIHRATVTQADLDYEGSITVDADLMRAADILPYEKVHIWNRSNGSRLETYALEAPAGSGVICVNGAAPVRGAMSTTVAVRPSTRSVASAVYFPLPPPRSMPRTWRNLRCTPWSACGIPPSPSRWASRVARALRRALTWRASIVFLP